MTTEVSQTFTFSKHDEVCTVYLDKDHTITSVRVDRMVFQFEHQGQPMFDGDQIVCQGAVIKAVETLPGLPEPIKAMYDGMVGQVCDLTFKDDLSWSFRIM